MKTLGMKKARKDKANKILRDLKKKKDEEAIATS